MAWIPWVAAAAVGFAVGFCAGIFAGLALREPWTVLRGEKGPRDHPPDTGP